MKNRFVYELYGKTTMEWDRAEWLPCYEKENGSRGNKERVGMDDHHGHIQWKKQLMMV